MATLNIEDIDQLPNVKLDDIAQIVGGITRSSVEGSAKRLNIPVIRTPTGRRLVGARGALLIIRELRERVRTGNFTVGGVHEQAPSKAHKGQRK